MDKKRLEIPAGVRYITEWDGYNLNDYAFPHILNKVLTGCGFTEYCLRNQQNIILLSPRKFLLENKEDQHKEDVLYVKNEFGAIVDYERNISDSRKKGKQKEPPKLSDEEIKSGISKMKGDIRDYCRKRFSEGRKPCKILVTYDSFRHVKETLQEMGIFQGFQVVVDEFQSIFIDSRFKSSTEMELLYYLRDVQKLCFVSATPMLDKYLEMLDEFKDLPYLELDWITKDPGRVKRPQLEIKFTKRSLNEEAGQVIQNYKKGNFEQRLDSGTGGIIESHEAVIFMNSVSNICQVIRSNNLHVEECNILCARTEENSKEVKKAFNEVLRRESEGFEKPLSLPRGYDVIGRIPGRGEIHKMFTFCTRTVYLGADFYSTNARTFIFSDANIECLAVDIGIDLEQILGRQRLDENPWKNSANLYVKTLTGKNSFTKEEFDNILAEKIKSTQNLLNVYEKGSLEEKADLAKNYEFVAKHNYYKDDYVSVNHHAGKSLKPVFNNLVLVSEMRTFEVQQIDYKDRFSVFSTLRDEGMNYEDNNISQVVEQFNEVKTTTEKLKFLVKYTTETPGVTERDIKTFISMIPGKYGDYYYLLGPDRIKANSYHESELRKEWIKMHSEVKVEDEMISEIYSTFSVSKKYGKAEIKQILKEIYGRYNFERTAKASDLGEYFIIKGIKLLDSGKWVHGFEILGKR